MSGEERSETEKIFEGSGINIVDAIVVIGTLWAMQWYPELILSFILSLIFVKLFDMYTMGGAIIPAIFAVWIMIRDWLIWPRPGFSIPNHEWWFIALMLGVIFIIGLAIEQRYSRIEWGRAYYVAVIPVAFLANIFIPWPFTPMIVIVSLTTDIVVWLMHPREDRFWLVIGGGGLGDGINYIYYLTIIFHTLLHYPILAGS